MSFKISAIENFKKEAQRLIKKYPSLQKELRDLGEHLAENPALVLLLAITVTKFAWQFLLKAKEKAEVQELLLIYILLKRLFSSFQFMINLNNQRFLIKN